MLAINNYMDIDNNTNPKIPKSASTIASDRKFLVLGLGNTGWSVAQHLHRRGSRFVVADTRKEPPFLEDFKKVMPDVQLLLGELPDDLVEMVDEVVVSPGIDLNHEWVQQLKAKNKKFISDIELWRSQTSPNVAQALIAISGSNGKSTVTSLVAKMARAQGLDVQVGGNLGVPVLSLEQDADLYVIELSSFQLDLIESLDADLACLLNITPDHMDRYDNFIDYYQSKQRIFRGAKKAVYNKLQVLTRPAQMPTKRICFGANEPDLGEFGIIHRSNSSYLAFGTKLIAALDDFKLKGAHNHLNILAALAISELQAWDLSKSLAVAKDFTGLAHRFQEVAKIRGVVYINDSKATNPDAALASIEALVPYAKRVHLILGGASKQADFSSVVNAVIDHKVDCYLIGEEAARINKLLAEKISIQVYKGDDIHKQVCQDMQAALSAIETRAQDGEAVLLAPACASFDAYENFMARGEDFTSLVQQLDKK